MPSWAGPVLGTAIVLGAMAGLHALGAGTLAAPPVTPGATFLDWIQSTDSTTVAMVALRLLALGVGYHLIATTALGFIGRLLRRPGLIRLAEWSTLPPFRSTFRRVAGIGLSASAALLTPLQGAGASGPGATAHLASSAESAVSPGHGSATAQRPWASPSTATLRLIDARPQDAPGGQATLRPVDPEAPSPESVPPEPTPTPGPDRTPTAAPPPSPERHTVVPGDHLWAIAEARLGDAISRTPTDAEIDPYWRTVVAANADLVDPDLLMPGSVVNVPPPRT